MYDMMIPMKSDNAPTIQMVASPKRRNTTFWITLTVLIALVCTVAYGFISAAHKSNMEQQNLDKTHQCNVSQFTQGPLFDYDKCMGE